jgi:hypothetical protein
VSVLQQTQSRFNGPCLEAEPSGSRSDSQPVSCQRADVEVGEVRGDVSDDQLAART